jgi:hypothetical protein
MQEQSSSSGGGGGGGGGSSGGSSEQGEEEYGAGIPAVAAALLRKSAQDAAEAEGAGGEGQGSRCRLGVGFKKRRGTPGYHTLLDAKGLLIGRPVPKDWAAQRPST